MAITRRAVYSPGRTDQSKDAHRSISRPKLHRGVKQVLPSIGYENVLGALGVAGIDRIGAFPELETLSTADGESGEGQNKRPNGGMHEMGGEGKDSH